MPAGIELDTWGGRHLVSRVGFQLRDTRVLGVGVAFHRSFEAVNLRFYARRSHPGGDRRGVVFVKELVPRHAIAWVARRSFEETYQALPMFHPDEVGASGRHYVSHGWCLGGREHRLGVRVAEAPCVPDLESGESFITEHCWGYVRQRDGSTLSCRVEHPRWPVGRGVEADLDCGVASLYGPQFVGTLMGPLRSAILAQGSAVVVRRGARIAWSLSKRIANITWILRVGTEKGSYGRDAPPIDP